jgi:hypothetical protein
MKSMKGRLNPVVFAFMFLVLVSCKKNFTHLSNAEIIGFDKRECICCGGLEITIESVTPPGGAQFFLVSEMPSSYKIGDNTTFPILVKIDYTIDTIACFGNFIKISRIANR